MKRNKVLLVAYSCNPYKGSEDGVGWAFAIGSSSILPTVLVTQSKNLPHIKAYLEGNNQIFPGERLELIGIDCSKVMHYVKKYVPFGSQIYYFVWQGKVRNYIDTELDICEFKIAHHVTWAVDWNRISILETKSLLKSNTKVIIGPLGGGTYPKLRFVARYLGTKGIFLAFLRMCTTKLLRLRNVKKFENANLIICQNTDTKDQLARFIDSGKILVRPNFCDLEFQNSWIRSKDMAVRNLNNTRLVYIGRIVPWKGIFLALETLSKLPDNFFLEIIGSGPAENAVRRKAKKLGIEQRVLLTGQVARHQVANRLSKASLLLFPSFHDSGPWVVGEAVACGVPIVCLNIGGSPLIASTGTSIAVNIQRDLPDKLAIAVKNVLKHPLTNTSVWSYENLKLDLANWYDEELNEPTI
jgi:glycosyltransferase involved in cell wall biosynthesis